MGEGTGEEGRGVAETATASEGIANAGPAVSASKMGFISGLLR